MTVAIETEMKTRPILFSGPMVRAILEGRKTQTRRVVKLAYEEFSKEWAAAVYPARDSGWIAWWPNDSPYLAEFTKKAYTDGFQCPYGKPGDRLWVRETWASQIDRPDFEEQLDQLDDSLVRTELTYRATPRIGIRVPGVIRPVDRMTYLDESTALEHHCFGWPIKWKPSIFMPRWASRITLEITDVRVERVQSISEEDAEAEGLYHSQDHISDLFGFEPGKFTNRTALGAFGRLWRSINEKKHPWSLNPWVWVVEFKRVEQPQ